ncbi:mechanosensitive ion channel family protein [Pontibacter vulgaris]|uniref:mechanosensitive ion channel family protein n=1 Tax=Pontibacter vulgaris TaxID=2905679 RepID=UPI001FA6FFEF|nr:mechanosensitive ion channel domain-containing protein [Pontibacter vulgaris]
MKLADIFFGSFDNLMIGIMQLVIGAFVGLVLAFVFFKLLDLYNKRESPQLTKSISNHLGAPVKVFLPLLFAAFTLALTPFNMEQRLFFRRFLEIMNIAVFGWMLIKVTYVVQDMLRHKYQISKPDNIRERRLFTQLQFIKKITIALIAFLTVAFILFSFEPVRTLGTGLLTSAGIAGVVLGFAAQRSLANLLAGLQIAFSQPIRIDDVLVVENEFGRVEEITLTYVVLRIWDQRRLILPLNYFIEKPFQNWTRSSADILATVYLYTDYTMPIDELRKELMRVLAATHLWDGKVAGLDLTDSQANSLQLRALMSADNSSIAWDLRCHVREKLITFIQKNYPESLPKTRTEFTGNPLQKYES